MKKQLNFNLIIFFIFIFCFHLCNAQNVTGYVYDEITKKPLISASVYFNNTTIGSVTNNDGYFELKKPLINTELIVSFLGYQTKVINPKNSKNTLTVFLNEEANELDVVEISFNDPYTRKEKLVMFKKAFLGKTANVVTCKILNEVDLKLRYNSKTRQLIVKSKKPIIILNKFLAYKLEYTLIDFVAEYGNFSLNKVAYIGTTKFYDLSTKKKIIKRRKKIYEGSILHFMRSIYNDKLSENKFGIIRNGMIVNDDNYFKIINRNNLVNVFTTKDTISIVYVKNKVNKQSKMIIENHKFIIDEFGNYNSNPQIMFSGEMGKQKICQMLPLNYYFH